MSIVSQNNTNEVALFDCIQRFFSMHPVGKLLKKWQAQKKKVCLPILCLNTSLATYSLAGACICNREPVLSKRIFQKMETYRSGSTRVQ